MDFSVEETACASPETLKPYSETSVSSLAFWWPELRYFGGEQREEERVNRKIRNHINKYTTKKKIQNKGVSFENKINFRGSISKLLDSVSTDELKGVTVFMR